MMRSENLLIGELTIEVTRKKNLKNLYIRVKPPEGDITVSAPTGITMDEVKLFVLGKLQKLPRCVIGCCHRRGKANESMYLGSHIICGENHIAYR